MKHLLSVSELATSVGGRISTTLLASVLLSAVMFPSPVAADIVFTIVGQDTDTVVAWSLSGTVTVDSVTNSEFDRVMQFPTASSSPYQAFATLGTGGIISTQVGTWSGDFTVSLNGGADFYNAAPLDFVAFDQPTGDYFFFRQADLASWPALSPGDTLSYSGSGTIDLGVPKNQVFVDGMYVGEALDHPTDTMRLNISSVPEPGAFLCGGLVAAVTSGLTATRRRRLATKDGA